MMIEDKQNILKSFEGRKIDESVHVKRWGTINTESNEDSNRMMFNKYARDQADSRQESASQENLFATQQSQVHEIDTGFKKLKTNQIEKLKELKQEYEVLRNLNIEQKPSINNMHPKVDSQSSSLHQSPSQQILSQSSRHKKSMVRNENMGREAQILSLQKKQLQMVINNSMRKIEQLLHNEMEYKKQIHELRLQVSGRQNVDVEYEGMIKTLKKNEMNQLQNNEALKKENQKNKFLIRQLNEKISAVENEMTMKDQEIRLLLGEKRKSEDLIRLQKDRYFNLDIEYKKTKMQYELLQKDKSNEINRLMKQLEHAGTNKTRDMQVKLKRFENDIEIKDKRYYLLMTQLQDMKTRYTLIEQEYQEYRSNYAMGQFDKEKMQQILVNFREQKDSVTIGRQISEVISKFQQADHDENDHLRQEIEMLKLQLQGVRQNDKQQTKTGNIHQYQQRIKELQRILRVQNQQKNELISRLKRFQREYDDMNRKFKQNQQNIQSYQSSQTKLRQQIRTLKQQTRTLRIKTQTSQPVRQFVQPIVDNRQSKELQLSMNETIKCRQQVEQLENVLRQTKRVADENQFRVTKTVTEFQFRLKMQQSQHNAVIVRIGEDMDRQRKESMKLKDQFEQYKQVTQKKLYQRQNELLNFRAKLRLSSDSKQSNINNIKFQYQSLLKSEREQYRLQVQQMSTQVTSLSKINEKYMQESSKYVHFENELSCLREIMRRSIHLSEGVDHLWRIKETEYQNANEVLKQILQEWRH